MRNPLTLPSARQTLRGAVIGYGFISERGHVPAYLSRAEGASPEQPAVEIVAVADFCEARRVAAAKALPNARIYTDYESLIGSEEGNLDFVDICTPPCDHAKIAHAALSAGLHVLCEKPLTPTVEEAAELLRHAEDAKRVLFPCHNYKHAPVVKAIREIIQSGTIGKVRSLSLSTYRNSHAKGVVEWKTGWRRDKKISGGGIAMDHGPHTFYLTFDWLGSYPTSVSAKMANLDSGKFDTEDNFSCALTFPNGVATANLTWTAGVRKVIYSIQGDRGAITVDDDELELATMETGDSRSPDVQWNYEKRTIRSEWMDASHVNWFNSMFDDFVGCIARGEWVGREAREAHLCIQLITTAYRSAEEGCRELPLGTTAEF